MIFDLVIKEAIIWPEHCNYTTFPYIQKFLSSNHPHHRFYESYCRLRLVCRNFYALLGDRPSQSFFDSTSLPLPISTRALYLNFAVLQATRFQRLLADPSTCGRLVYLDVTCALPLIPRRTHLFSFLAATPEEAFPNVQRLSLRIDKASWVPRDYTDYSFWRRLHRAFPLVVTLVITVDQGHYGCLILSEMVWEPVTFERMETLHLEGSIMYSGCHFPRLRHASIFSTDRFLTTHLLKLSPHIESLVAGPTWRGQPIDAGSFSRLRSLGIPKSWLQEVVPLDRYHPLECLWLLSCDVPDDYGEYGPFKEILEKAPGISQIIVDLSSPPWKRPKPCIDEFRRMNMDSIGLSVIPSAYGDHILVCRRSNAVVK